MPVTRDFQKYTVLFTGFVGWRMFVNEPVLPDGNHNGYNINVTVKLLTPKPYLSVGTRVQYTKGLFGIRVPTYYATITADSDEMMRITKVEYSAIGLLYTAGEQMRSPLPISHFFIRVTTDSGRYVYEYLNGRIIER